MEFQVDTYLQCFFSYAQSKNVVWNICKGNNFKIMQELCFLGIAADKIFPPFNLISHFRVIP
jgi:hypothetical protein